MTRRKKLFVFGGVAVAIVALVALNAAKGGDRAASVRIETVERRALVSTVTASGQIEPQTSVDVSADITGRIIRIPVQEGDIVTLRVRNARGDRRRLAVVAAQPNHQRPWIAVRFVEQYLRPTVDTAVVHEQQLVVDVRALQDRRKLAIKLRHVFPFVVQRYDDREVHSPQNAGTSVRLRNCL